MQAAKGRKESSPSPDQYFDVLATAGGLALVSAFMRIPDGQLRRTFVRLIKMTANTYK